MDPTEDRFSDTPTGISIYLFLQNMQKKKRREMLEKRKKDTDNRFLGL